MFPDGEEGVLLGWEGNLAELFVGEDLESALEGGGETRGLTNSGHQDIVALPHRAAVISNPQAMNNIPTESTASKSSIPTTPLLRVAVPASP